MPSTLPILLVSGSTLLMAASGVPGLFLSWRSPWGQRIAAALAVPASAAGLAGAFLVLTGTEAPPCRLPWSLPGASFDIEMDALSAFFLVPIFLMGGLGSVYSLGYWKQSEHPANGRRMRFFWGTIVAGLALLVVARNGILFIFGWEVMALSSFFLVATEDHEDGARRASWIYLFATHVATLCLFALFALIHRLTGSLEMRALRPEEIGPAPAAVFFVLALVVFGIKSGLMPFHVWLPPAHASAPSHVSAMMSGVVIKMGIYGFIRFIGYLPSPPVGWGALLLLLGAVSAVLGVAFALGQHDLKRLLAYHSVENIGIIVMGLGLAVLGRTLRQPEWVLLGMAGCLLHVWNHSFFKGLLFLSAGSVVHAMRSREIDRMGGLSRGMPSTAGLFAIGALAICGLPPLNGFVSEFLVYMGLFKTAGVGGGAASACLLGAPVLAMVGALAVACFVKVYGAVFLGSPRTDRASRVHESPWTLLVPMGVLAFACAFIGLLPFTVAPLLERAVAAWTPQEPGSQGRLASLAPLETLSVIAMTLSGILALLGLAWLLRRRAGPVGRTVTWDCGYAAPSARMQYTASSFAESLVGLLSWALRPRRHPPRIEGLFPAPSKGESHVGDVVMDDLIVPFLGWMRRHIEALRARLGTLVQHYLLYGALTLVLLLLWISPWDELFRRLFTR
ncbi:MAG TPA: proton-conducting transporter membrane subunit [Planctomycetota bacterium]|nr:proton-conducting transporter membrane subunit [Planctomycetota bacterium]